MGGNKFEIQFFILGVCYGVPFFSKNKNKLALNTILTVLSFIN